VKYKTRSASCGHFEGPTPWGKAEGNIERADTAMRIPAKTIASLG
jgi:hypothetical protein